MDGGNALVGALVRVDPDTASDAVQTLSQLPGVTVFPVGEDGAMGVLVRARDLDAAWSRLEFDVANTRGVRATFPLQAHVSPDPPPS